MLAGPLQHNCSESLPMVGRCIYAVVKRLLKHSIKSAELQLNYILVISTYMSTSTCKKP